MFQSRFVEKFKTHFMFSNFFFRKPCCLWDNVEKYSRARQATDDIVTIARISCCIPKTTDTHSEYAILIAYHYDSGCTDAPLGYVIRTLPAFSPKINLTLLYRRVSKCRPPALRQPSLLPEVFLTQDRARALNCWQVIFECIPSFLVIYVEFSHKL